MNFSRRSVIRDSTKYRLYAGDSPENTLSNRGSAIAAIILWVKILNFKKIDFWSKILENSVEDQWPFWEHIINSTPYRLFANGNPEDPLSNRGSAIAEIMLWVEILNLKKINFWSKVDKNSLKDQQPFGNI